MSKIITGLKTSEMIELFEQDKAESCKPEDYVGHKFDSIDSWSLRARLYNTWSVTLKEQKIEITEEQLDKAWDEFVAQKVIIAAGSKCYGTYHDFKKALGFHD